MSAPTPRDAAPAVQRRLEVVAEVEKSLDGVDDLPMPERLARLEEAQRSLQAALNNSAGAGQPPMPGVR